MAYSYIKVSAAAGQTSVPFDFDYLEPSEIVVSINDVATSGWTLSSPNVVAFDTPLSVGDIVEVERVTNLTTRAVDFSSGAVLTEEDLDLSAQQVFNAAQEALDSTEKNLSKDYTDNYNAYGKKITGVAKGVDPTDVINKAQLDYDYPAVKHVSDNMDDVNVLVDNMADINRVEDSIDNIDRVHTSIDKVDRVHQSIAKVDRVYTSVDEIDRVHTSIANVDRVYTSIDNIDRVDESIAKVDRVYTSIAEIDRVHQSIGKIDTVEGDITRIDTVADNILDVNNVSDNMADINEVQDNLAAVNTVADNVADVNTVADNITDVNTIVANLDDVRYLADEIDLKVRTQIGTLQDFALSNGIYEFSIGPAQPEHSTVEVGHIITLDNVAMQFKVVDVVRTNHTFLKCEPYGTNTSSLSAITTAFMNNAAVFMDASAIEAVAAVKEEIASLGPITSALTRIDSRYDDYVTANNNAGNITAVANDIYKVNYVYYNRDMITRVDANEQNIRDAVAQNAEITTVANNVNDVVTVAQDISIIQDASTTLDGLNSSLIQMATAFTNGQTRFVEEHAFE